MCLCLKWFSQEWKFLFWSATTGKTLNPRRLDAIKVSKLKACTPHSPQNGSYRKKLFLRSLKTSERVALYFTYTGPLWWNGNPNQRTNWTLINLALQIDIQCGSCPQAREWQHQRIFTPSQWIIVQTIIQKLSRSRENKKQISLHSCIFLLCKKSPGKEGNVNDGCYLDVVWNEIKQIDQRIVFTQTVNISNHNYKCPACENDHGGDGVGGSNPRLHHRITPLMVPNNSC